MRLARLALLSLAAAASGAAPAQVAIVSHRGLAGDAPENSLAAFRQSVERGVAIIELDLRLTRDGQLVVLHDRTLDRTTDCSGSVALLDMAAVKRCDVGNGEQVPSFAEVMALVGDQPVRVLADIKEGTPLAAVIAAVRHHRAERKVILGLRSTAQVAQARAALPGTTVLANLPEIGDAPAFAAAGAHAIRLWSDWVEADPARVAHVRALGPEVWIMVGRRLPSKRRGWRALHARMIAAGAQGLITDRPELAPAP